jgi:hypothetical protein
MVIGAGSELKMADFYVSLVCQIYEMRLISTKQQSILPLCSLPLTFVFCTHASRSIHKLQVILSLCTEPVNRNVFTTSIQHMHEVYP